MSCRVSWLLTLWVGLSVWSAAPAAQTVSESRLKLAYLYNFAQFIEWPADKLPEGAPLRICLLSPDPFGDEADALTNRRVRSHPIEVLRPRRGQELPSCHIVFAPQITPSELSRGADWLRRPGQLVISDEPGSIRQGATIQFVVQNARLRWHIDHEQARQLGLRPSAKLLELSLPLPAP